MSLKDTLAKKIETQTDYWNKQIEKIRTDAETKKAQAKDQQAQAEIEKEVSEQIQDLQERIDEAQDKLKEVRDAGESQIKTIQGAVESWLSQRSGKK